LLSEPRVALPDELLAQGPSSSAESHEESRSPDGPARSSCPSSQPYSGAWRSAGELLEELPAGCPTCPHIRRVLCRRMSDLSALDRTFAAFCRVASGEKLARGLAGSAQRRR